MSYIIGLDGKAYHNTGSFGTPTWDEITNTVEATATIDGSEAQLKARGLGWAQHKKGVKVMAISLTMLYDHDDTDFQAIRDAFLNGTVIDLAFVDGAIATSGNQGPRAEFEVLSMERGEPLEEGWTVVFTLKPGISSNSPEWLETA